MRNTLLMLIVLATLAGMSMGFEAMVVDTTDQAVGIRKVQNSEQPPREYLSVATDSWVYDIHFSLIREAKLDSGAKKKNAYDPTPFIVVLTNETTIKGTMSKSLTGESDFGKAVVTHDKIKSATFKKEAEDADFKPSKEGLAANVKGQVGTALRLTSVVFHTGNRHSPAKEIVGKRGAVTLSIPVDNIERIESGGTVKEKYGTKTKWIVTLVSGKSTEIVLKQNYNLTGECDFGEATLNSSNLQSAAFEKKSN